jgi:hypothetical protein
MAQQYDIGLQVFFGGRGLCGDALLTRLLVDARPEDGVLLIGARDPSLPALARNVVEMFGGQMRTSHGTVRSYRC